MFGLGDKAFYPAHGVGVIEKIEQTKASGTDESYYVVRIIDTGLTVSVPKSKAPSVGLRHLISNDKVSDVLKVLKVKKSDKIQKTSTPWNRRQRDYLAKIKTGSTLDHAEILKELFMLQGQKQLSFGEKKLMEQVRKLLTKELACCQNCTEEIVHNTIDSLLAS